MALHSLDNGQRALIWRRVEARLLQHAVPDARFHHDFSQFVPDFRGSSSAIDRILALPCYASANIIAATSDNSLEQLRYRALQDGKRVLVGTHELRRGFVMLDPRRIAKDRLELAASLDGMERPGVGRHVDLVHMCEEDVKVDMFVTGCLAITTQGLAFPRSQSHSELQWLILQDRDILGTHTPAVAVAHGCQVVDEAVGLEHPSELRCDSIVTPEKMIEIEGANKPEPDFPFADPYNAFLPSVPLLQELKGIKMMEQIMQGAGFAQESTISSQTPSANEQMGIDMVEKLMKGYKV